MQCDMNYSYLPFQYDFKHDMIGRNCNTIQCNGIYLLFITYINLNIAGLLLRVAIRLI